MRRTAEVVQWIKKLGLPYNVEERMDYDIIELESGGDIHHLLLEENGVIDFYGAYIADEAEFQTWFA